MKNKLLSILIIIFSACALSFTLTACGHTHDYKTLKYDNEQHWFECECGEKMNETTHNIINGGCVCGYVLTHTHNYETLNYNETEHWNECACGEKQDIESHKGGTATETNKAVCEVCNQEYGSTLGHSHAFTEQVVQDKYLKEKAKCESKAKYYYSCECGEFGSTWFEYGEELGHSYTNYVSDNNATYESDGTKTATCERNGCGEKHTIVDTGSMLGSYISFKTLSVDNNTVYGVVSNDTETFSFIDEVEVKGKSKYIVSLDVYGFETALTKTIHLNIGDNKVYIIELIDDEVKNVYNVTIRRKPIYTVSFSTSGSSVESQRVEEGYLATTPTPPTRTGYTFDGWDYKFSSPITKDTTITASWNTIEYSIVYNLNDGSLSTTKNSYTIEQVVVLDNPTRDYYTFSGWYNNADFNGSKITKLTIGTYGDIELYAKWTPIDYGITYVLNGGTNNKNNPTKYNVETSTITLNNSTRDGYTFDGWYLEETFNIEVTQIEQGSHDSVKLFAKWNVNQYKITFVLNNGEDSVVLTQDYNTNVTPPVPVRAGYMYLWDKSVPTRMPAEDLVITAIWTPIFKVTNGCITGLNVAENSITELKIPSVIDGATITSIGDNAFSSCYMLTSVEIPDSVTTIGDYAFEDCSSLTSIEIPNSVTSIGDQVFYNCDSLTSIVIPDSVTSIGDQVFYNCDSLQYNVKDNLKYLGNNTNPYLYLANVTSTSITSATIDSNCRFIGNEAFLGHPSLTSIVIPDSVTSIGNSAFYNCNSLQYNVKDNLKYLGNNTNPYLYLIDTTSTSITSATIDSNCRFIGDSAFYYCSKLTSIEIGDSVTSIGDCAFYDCLDLTSIEIGDNVTSIGDWAFYNCYSLTSIVIPDSVTSIGDCAFEYCDSLTSIEIGDSVTSIGDYAFYGCSSLTSIEIGDSVTSIGDWAFYSCYLLTSIVIPDSVTSIGDCAFRDCASLTIYCEAKSKPSGWISSWNYSNRPVVWGCKGENE